MTGPQVALMAAEPMPNAKPLKVSGMTSPGGLPGDAPPLTFSRTA
jgi:hypothetical protein